MRLELWMQLLLTTWLGAVFALGQRWDEVECGDNWEVIPSIVAFDREWEEPTEAVSMTFMPLDALVRSWTSACFPDVNRPLLYSPIAQNFIITFVNASNLRYPCFLPAIFHRMSVSVELRAFRRNRFFLGAWDRSVSEKMAGECLNKSGPEDVLQPSWATGVVHRFLPVHLIWLKSIPKAVTEAESWWRHNASETMSESEWLRRMPRCQLTFRSTGRGRGLGLQLSHSTLFLLGFSMAIVICMLLMTCVRCVPERREPSGASRARVRRDTSLSQELTSAIRIRGLNERIREHYGPASR